MLNSKGIDIVYTTQEKTYLKDLFRHKTVFLFFYINYTSLLRTSTKSQFLIVYHFSMKAESCLDITILNKSKAVHTIFI